jgi:hypothetical protein
MSGSYGAAMWPTRVDEFAGAVMIGDASGSDEQVPFEIDAASLKPFRRRPHAAPPTIWARFAFESAGFTPITAGLPVSGAEFQVRYAHLPLDDYRARMKPEIYATMVRFLGLIPGDGTFDAVQATEMLTE